MSALPLLVLRNDANDADNAIALDDLAFIANALHARTDFHGDFFPCLNTCLPRLGDGPAVVNGEFRRKRRVYPAVSTAGNGRGEKVTGSGR